MSEKKEHLDICPLCDGNMDAVTYVKDEDIEIWRCQYCDKFERKVKWLTMGSDAKYQILSQTVIKKCDPDLFDMILRGEKNIDIRLHEFDVQDGWILRLEEYDRDAQKYSARVLERVIIHHYSIKPTLWFAIKDIEEKGLIVMELGDES